MTDAPVELCRVTMDKRLADVEPVAYGFLVNFAKDNELQVRAGGLVTSCL